MSCGLGNLEEFENLAFAPICKTVGVAKVDYGTNFYFLLVAFGGGERRSGHDGEFLTRRCCFSAHRCRVEKGSAVKYILGDLIEGVVVRCD